MVPPEHDELELYSSSQRRLEFYNSPGVTTMGQRAHTFFRVLFSIFNLLFVLLGLGLIAAGAVARLAYGKYLSFLDHGYASAPLFVIFVGLAITIVSFFGCCGYIKNNQCMLITFAGLLGVLLILEIAGAIAAYVEGGKIANYLQTHMKESMGNYTTGDVIWEGMQRELHCCGVVTFKDWQEQSQPVPKSCCKIDNCSFNTTILDECPKIGDLCPINIDGCFTLLQANVTSHIGIIGGVAVAIAVIQIIGMIAAGCIVSKNYSRGYMKT